MSERDGGIRPSVLALVVVATAMLVFAPALSGPFIFDDRPLIATNVFVHDFASWKRWFVTDFWNLGEDFIRRSSRIIYWRPLVSASYALEWKLGGGNPTLFHAVNLLWHGLCALLAFRALRRWSDSILPAFLAALLFAVHPTKAESVAWIAGRTDVLCIAAMLLVAEGASRRLRGEVRTGLSLEVLGTMLAYGTKEQAITLPAFVAVESWAYLGRPALDGKVVRRVLRSAMPQLALAVVYLILRQKFLPMRPHMFTAGARDWLLMTLETWGRYFELTIMPHDLSVQQGLLKVANGRLVVSTPHVAAGIAGLLGLCHVAYRQRLTRPAITMGITFYLALLVPTSNVVPTGMITLLSERFLYAPVLGLGLVMASLMVEATAVQRGRAFSLAGLAALVLGATAARHSADFDDETAFWAREGRLHPESMEAVRFLKGKALLEHRYRAALEGAAQLQHICATNYGYIGCELDALVEGVEALSILTPDGDTATLAAIARFYADLLDDKVTTPALTTAAVKIVVPRKASIQKSIAKIDYHIRSLEAAVRSRIGRDAEAIAAAKDAIARCELCGSVWLEGALVQARAGDFAAAHAWLDESLKRQGSEFVAPMRAQVQRAELASRQAAVAEGVVKIVLEAEAFSRLEAWGRAYALLAPHKEPIKQAPGFALTFAELAYRAGDEKAAREVLAAVRPADAVEPTLKDWARKMGW